MHGRLLLALALLGCSDEPTFWLGGTAVYMDCPQSPDIKEIVNDWDEARACLAEMGATEFPDIVVYVREDVESKCINEEAACCYLTGVGEAYVTCGNEAYCIPHESQHAAFEEECGRYASCMDYPHERKEWVCIFGLDK